MKKIIMAAITACMIASGGFANDIAGFATVGTGVMGGVRPGDSPVGIYAGFALFDLSLSSSEEEFALIGGGSYAANRTIAKDDSYGYKIGIFAPLNTKNNMSFGIGLNMRRVNESGKIRLADGRDELYVRNKTFLRSVDIDFFLPFKMDFIKGRDLLFQFGLQLMPGDEEKIDISNFNGATGKGKISERGVGLTLSVGIKF